MISDNTNTGTEEGNEWTQTSQRRAQLVRAEVASSFTSANVAIKAYSESKVSGELDLPRVHCDGQTINWTERRHNTLSIHLQEIQYDCSMCFLPQETVTNKMCFHQINY